MAFPLQEAHSTVTSLDLEKSSKRGVPRKNLMVLENSATQHVRLPHHRYACTERTTESCACARQTKNVANALLECHRMESFINGRGGKHALQEPHMHEFWPIPRHACGELLRTSLGALILRVGAGKAACLPAMKSTGLCSEGTLSCITGEFR